MSWCLVVDFRVPFKKSSIYIITVCILVVERL